MTMASIKCATVQFRHRANDKAYNMSRLSMPGFGFSGKPTTTGWEPVRIGLDSADEAPWNTRFVAQGGDWGALVVDQMGVQAPPGLIGIHTNQPGAVPPDVSKAAQSGGPAPSGLSDEERERYEKLKEFWATDVAYALEMGTRPQTLYGLADSPVGLAAWILDHDIVSYELIARVFDGRVEGLTRDDVLEQHHALLVDERGDFCGTSLLGKQVVLFRAEERVHPGSREHLS
jgi:hypothetical protein